MPLKASSGEATRGLTHLTSSISRISTYRLTNPLYIKRKVVSKEEIVKSDFSGIVRDMTWTKN